LFYVGKKFVLDNLWGFVESLSVMQSDKRAKVLDNFVLLLISIVC